MRSDRQRFDEETIGCEVLDAADEGFFQELYITDTETGEDKYVFMTVAEYERIWNQVDGG